MKDKKEEDFIDWVTGEGEEDGLMEKKLRDRDPDFSVNYLLWWWKAADLFSGFSLLHLVQIRTLTCEFVFMLIGSWKVPQAANCPASAKNQCNNRQTCPFRAVSAIERYQILFHLCWCLSPTIPTQRLQSYSGLTWLSKALNRFHRSLSDRFINELLTHSSF